MRTAICNCEVLMSFFLVFFALPERGIMVEGKSLYAITLQWSQ